MTILKWLWSYLGKYKLALIAGGLFIMINIAVAMNNQIQTGRIIDLVVKQGRTDKLAGILLLLASLVILRSVLKYTYNYIFEKVSITVITKMRMYLYDHIQGMDFRFFDTTRTGDIMAKMTADLDVVRHFCAYVIPTIWDSLVVFITAIVILIIMSPMLTLCMVVIAPFIAFFAHKLVKNVRSIFNNIREAYYRLNTVVQENISGHRVVKAFSREGYEENKFAKENGDYMEANLAGSRVWAKYLPVLDGISGALWVVTMFAGSIFVYTGKMTIGTLVAYNGLVWALSNPMRLTGWLINDAQRFFASAEKIISLYDSKSDITSAEDAQNPGSLKGVVEFRDVSFGYGDEEVLRNISFTAHPGQTVAVVGPTGSGKSTLISLINRFYDCTSGDIFIDGINIKNIDLGLLRRSISSAMQDIFLFSDTVEGNIVYGKPDAEMDQVYKVATTAAADGFIRNLSDGYDTIIGERGVGLSGGQKQRIALSRALMKDSSILILDDTTSSVDVETEHSIQNAMKEYCKAKTTFIIAHRISQVKNADMILVIKDGGIIERGTHEELLAMRGYYFGIHINQLGGGIFGAE